VDSSESVGCCGSNRVSGVDWVAVICILLCTDCCTEFEMVCAVCVRALCDHGYAWQLLIGKLG
jgi:hypothetical protein